jgi:Tol biopolymer transport system component
MPAVSPDGARIAFVSDRGGGPDLWTMAADGSDPWPLLSGPGDDLSPQYSADGQFVVLSTNASGNFDVAYVPVAGAPHATATSITFRSSIDETTPAIQPDMVRLAYTQTNPSLPGPSDIFTAYADDGTDEFPLAVDPAAHERQPAFSPDSTEVVYVTDAGLVVAAAGGSSPRAVATPGASAPADPDWAVGPPLDRTPPQTKITREPRRRIERRRARFRFRSSEAGAGFECKFDRLAFEQCSSPATYVHLKRRRHRFRVRAIDAGGNVDPSPAKARFRVVARR